MSPALISDLIDSPHTNGTSKKGHHEEEFGFGTRAIHVGSEPNPETGAVIPSISLSTTYKQDAIGVHKGFEYSRSGNPNRNALESTLASIEAGGAYALALASGSATTATVLQSLGPNSHVISVNDVYGGTFRYMSRVAGSNQGLQVSWVDFENESDENILAHFRDNTKLIWIESPTNPTLRLIDIPRIVALARSHPSKPLVLVDNTFLSPFYQSPLLLGADIVMHSLTKYINGHSDVIMGALILPAHHAKLAEDLRFLQNAIGAVPSAFDCWLAQRGVKTLHLRMRQHGRNAVLVAQALEEEKNREGGVVEDVIYPGLKTHPRNELAYRLLSPHARGFVNEFVASNSLITSAASTPSSSIPSTPGATTTFPYGGMISFRVRGGIDGAQAFLTSLKLFALAESLGGVESLAEHPAVMTHGSIPEAERAKLGITDGLVRLSVGVEEGVDLVRDLRSALDAVRAVVGQK